MLEIGKKYMFSAAKAKKNKVPNLYGGDTKIKTYQEDNDGYWRNRSTWVPDATLVMWSEEEPFAVKVMDGMKQVKAEMVQKIRVCVPFKKFDVYEVYSVVPGALELLTEAMPADGQKVFETKFLNDVTSMQINELW